MFRLDSKLIKVIVILIFVSFTPISSHGEEEINPILEKLQQDIQTLEKAVYSQSSLQQTSSDNGNEDVLTRHLLKLNEIEEQFQSLTNKFEEINFKLDKLSNRISKIQRDNQLRFQELERISSTGDGSVVAKTKKLPGSDEPQDLGSISDTDLEQAQEVQQTQSIETVGSVITETAERAEKILPEDKSPAEKYKFAISFLKVGDYETAEIALREFVDTHSNHELAGSAQYWYGETFRVRQLYQDAATAYLNGYQKYPKSKKAPVNLLKLGVTLVQIGEKEQGCLMISGVLVQYPKASQAVVEKAKYEKQKFKCEKKS